MGSNPTKWLQDLYFACGWAGIYFPMGFDKNDSQPLIRPRRWSSKINFAMAFGVIVFLGIGIVGICWMHSHRPADANVVQQNSADKH